MFLYRRVSLTLSSYIKLFINFGNKPDASINIRLDIPFLEAAVRKYFICAAESPKYEENVTIIFFSSNKISRNASLSILDILDITFELSNLSLGIFAKFDKYLFTDSKSLVALNSSSLSI